jgi:hypothetical protein
MNITIKITHSNGTVLNISIPVLTPETTASAVTTPPEPQVASEPAIPAADAPPMQSSNEQVEESIPFIAGDKAVKFLEEQFGFNPLACDTTGEKRVGEDEVGAGRIGGMGERKGEGGEGEGGEENRVLVFKCQDGDYTLPPALHNDFKSAFGADMVDRELTKARLWCETNPQSRKTRRGMGRFLNAWLCRAQGEKRVPISKRSGSLLDACNSTQEGW